jgi:hypothetical protein
MPPNARAQGRGELLREGRGVGVDDEVHLGHRPAQQQVPDRAADRVKARLAAPRETPGLADRPPQRGGKSTQIETGSPIPDSRFPIHDSRL